MDLIQPVLQGISVDKKLLRRFSDAEPVHVIGKQGIQEKRSVCMIIFLQLSQPFIALIQDLIMVVVIEQILIDPHGCCT